MAQFDPQDLFLSPAGSDQWTGRLAEPNADKTDGPLATLAAAQRLLRQRKADAGGKLPRQVTVWLRGGAYGLAEPLTFTADDSGPITFAAYPGETPVLDGGVPIAGWKEEQVHGQRAWVADLPDVRAGWTFRCLYVNGQRRHQPRAPRQGFFIMQDVPGLKLPADWANGPRQQSAFIARPGDFGAFRNLTDVEMVVVHWWIEERFPVVAYDPATRLVTLGRTSRGPLADDRQQTYARYYLNNVWEQLKEPGQWYLDRPAGKLYYLPLPGEDPRTTQVVAPRALQLLKLVGEPDANRWVQTISFRGITFAHTDWRHPGEDGAAVSVNSASARYGRGNDAAASQAACDVPGVVYLEGARNCAFEDCTVRNTGWYGVEMADGCTNNRVVGCTLRDLGAGGVKLNGSDAAGPRLRRTGDNVITDNEIVAGGRVFHSAVGVLAMHTFGNTIAHNHIHDLYYTGISVGWVWGYRESVARDNRVEKNHIHRIGQGLLSDMGGIYTLGVQPGTVIRGNLVHDVQKLNYGGWCIYPDEGSSHILIENNICYDTNGEIFHQHYGRENIVRNNIFAFGGDAIVAHSRADDHLGFTLERNILVTRGAPIFKAGYGNTVQRRNHLADLNLLWDVEDQPLAFVDSKTKLDFRQWQKLGQDGYSIVADPKFRDLAGRDFALGPDSPAFAVGFQAIDVSDIGPRPAHKSE